ncbi:ATP-binding cassette domain-containing protein [Conexibacter arvalis]|uniref:Simple sugar transport system ATP-binding protein n=1 Tax=Conexibacter arvalis TaxID=912552 RepID=A0A840IDT3_9ACTN|nr:ATP-binding cassette domain-containing protein [Conexibacter arvalis]MBB4662411.1 simple sugar transport system ATP-binding protein [Conexibacter arvalis]
MRPPVSTAERSTARAHAIELRDITKSFGHIQALRGATLQIRAGEVLAVVGDNGAGKSTLMKALSGNVVPTSGEIVIDGASAEIASVADAQRRGIFTVYQDLAQAPDLSALENVFLGREQLLGGIGRRIGLLARGEMRRRAEQALDDLGVTIPSVSRPVRDLSGGQRQAVAIARAVMWATTAVVMDEPTAALGARQTAIVYDTIKATAARGLAVVVVSHDIPNIVSLADRIAIMRHGRVLVTLESEKTNVDEVLRLMLGAEVTQ